jgi:hypothetical protein
MKYVKLFFMKLTYWFDLNFGPYFVNDRKFDNHIENLIERKQNISQLENEINNIK